MLDGAPRTKERSKFLNIKKNMGSNGSIYLQVHKHILILDREWLSKLMKCNFVSFLCRVSGGTATLIIHDASNVGQLWGNSGEHPTLSRMAMLTWIIVPLITWGA